MTLPRFNDIDIAQFPTKLDAMLKKNLAEIEHLCQQKSANWQSLMQPLERMENDLERFWSPFSHLHAVMNSPTHREAYQACLPMLSAYESAIGQNEALYKTMKSITPAELNDVQKHILADAILDFELSGVALTGEKKARFEVISARLSELTNQFENRVLDAQQAFALDIEDTARLSGLPEYIREAAAENAKAEGKVGYRLTLDFPTYYAVVSFADDAALRRAFYEAWVTRASDVGPNAGTYDNSLVMQEILALRQEKAALLGYEDYASLSLATKMAESKTRVFQFLDELVDKAKPQALKEKQELLDFVKKEYGNEAPEPWDIAYYAEKLQQARYAFSEEDVRPYFPVSAVLRGLFEHITRLYGIRLEAIEADVWHADVQCFALKSTSNAITGYVYMDLFARPNKRGGAWMDSLQSRWRDADGNLQLPIALLTCNFARPVGGKEGTLSHDEVQTLFHEMGHCLHHLLTQVEYLSASGIHGVEWDAVELPSQFFESWCWERESVVLLTEHVDTKEPMPMSLFAKMQRARHFQSAMAMMRQLEFSIFDFRLHAVKTPDAKTVMDTLAAVRSKTALFPPSPMNRMAHSFAHIFAGGYAAGYYSYKWAEVLSCDAFGRFEEEGIFNPETGRAFLEEILAVGGSRDANASFVAFRGREPQIEALLRHNGIMVE